MHVDHPEKHKLTIASFFSGYEGLGIGVKQAIGGNARVIVACEIESYAIANLIAKMEDGKLDACPVWTNIKNFPAEQFHGLVDIVIGGYPCQGFSCAGKRRGLEDERYLWPYLRRICQTIKPRQIFLENVEGHVTLGLSTVISDLEEDGYRTTWGLFTAAEVGAPHRRKRVFILANRNGIDRGTQTEKRDNDGQVGFAGEAMANASEFGRGRRCESRGEIRERGMSENKVERSGASSENLADTNQPGSQGRDSGELPERAVKWPARPGSPQYDWEPPRTVPVHVGPKPTTLGQYQTAIESVICGSSYGASDAMDAIANRVDRLRLCGNGVVPQQAARAYQVLSERMKP